MLFLWKVNDDKRSEAADEVAEHESTPSMALKISF